MAKKKEKSVSFENKLKKLSVGKIERAVEKAISELVGDGYQVNINKIDFKFEDCSFGRETCDLQLSIERDSDFDDDIPF